MKPNNICSKQKEKCGTIQVQISSHNLVEKGQDQNKLNTSSGSPSQKERFINISFFGKKQNF